jgi:aryl-alcohol dehydrogenase-like predicted oxidoreductase
VAQRALRSILMHEEVTAVIPGARHPQQAADNAAASDLPPLNGDDMAAVRNMYDRCIRAHVHERW